jgi:hypothetical protein
MVNCKVGTIGMLANLADISEQRNQNQPLMLPNFKRMARTAKETSSGEKGPIK